MADPTPHVGTMREKPLHASLKRWCARDGDKFEMPVDGFVIDVVRGDLLIEVQTRGFSSMKRKLGQLLAMGHRVRIVHPIPTSKWIVKVDADGVVLGRRMSPQHGSPIDIFKELVSFPDLITNPGLEIQLVLTHEEEYRHHDPTKAWRRKGWVVDERRLLSVEGTVDIRNSADLGVLIPAGLPDPFTTSDLAKALGRPRRLGQQMAYCLHNASVIEQSGKRGNAIEYRMRPAPNAESTAT